MPADELLTGWGRTAPSRAAVVDVTTPEEVDKALADPPPRGVVARGLGCSDCDAAQNSGGAVVRMTSLAAVHSLDVADAAVTVDAGLSLDRLTRMVVPFGLFPWVTPGTNQVTIGGAIAADIHGKGHHRDGTFGEHVLGMTLRTPGRGTLALGPGDPEFWATTGGMGLTGVVTEATLSLQRIETSLMKVDTERAVDLDDLLARMDAGDRNYHYSVAWIDLLATGRSLGRSVLTRGEHAALDDLPGRQRRSDPLAYAPRDLLAAPPWVPAGLLNRLSVRAFNEFWFRKAPREQRGHLESIRAFFHPLDGVAEWNRIYGRPGFLQWQFAVPFGAAGEAALRTCVERLSGAGIASFLAVLKRFGPSNRGLLSFPTEGWTLALDIPAVGGSLGPLLDSLDEVVVDAGGRIYLAKDSRVRPELLPHMYPRLAEFRRLRSELDPAGVLQSDLSRRLWTLTSETRP